MPNPNITYVISPKSFSIFKEKARKLKISKNIKHHEALEQIAKDAGLDNWNQIAQSHKKFEPFFNSFHNGIVVALNKDFFPQSFTEECTKNFIQDNHSVLYREGREDIKKNYPRSEVYYDNDIEKIDNFTDSEIEEFVNEKELECAFYAYNGKKSYKNNKETILSIADCLNGDLPQYMWINKEYINISEWGKDQEIQLRCSSVYIKYRHMSEGDEEFIPIEQSIPDPLRDVNFLKQLEEQKKVKIVSLQESYVRFLKLPETSNLATTKYRSLKNALIAAKSKSDDDITIVGVAYVPSDTYSPYQFFEVMFDHDENWNCIYFNGGRLWEDGSSGEDESYCNDSLDELVSEIKETFPQIDNIVFFETYSMDFELYAEGILYKVFSDLPGPDDYWLDNKEEYEKLCIERINKANSMK